MSAAADNVAVATPLADSPAPQLAATRSPDDTPLRRSPPRPPTALSTHIPALAGGRATPWRPSAAAAGRSTPPPPTRPPPPPRSAWAVDRSATPASAAASLHAPRHRRFRHASARNTPPAAPTVLARCAPAALRSDALASPASRAAPLAPHTPPPPTHSPATLHLPSPATHWKPCCSRCTPASAPTPPDAPRHCASPLPAAETPLSTRFHPSRLSLPNSTVIPSPILGLSPGSQTRQPERARVPIAHRGAVTTGAVWMRTWAGRYRIMSELLPKASAVNGSGDGVVVTEEALMNGIRPVVYADGAAGGATGDGGAGRGAGGVFVGAPAIARHRRPRCEPLQRTAQRHKARRTGECGRRTEAISEWGRVEATAARVRCLCHLRAVYHVHRGIDAARPGRLRLLRVPQRAIWRMRHGAERVQWQLRHAARCAPVAGERRAFCPGGRGAAAAVL
eukprot:ctg_631.g342